MAAARLNSLSSVTDITPVNHQVKESHKININMTAMKGKEKPSYS